MAKRKGETLVEFLTAAAVFGIVSVGIFSFMANQTENLAAIKERDSIIFYARLYDIAPTVVDKDLVKDKATKEGIKIDPQDSKTLVLSKGEKIKLNFILEP